jgi:hypothetical protein
MGGLLLRAEALPPGGVLLGQSARLPQARARRGATPNQWQARQNILKTTPLNIGKPERVARRCMPLDFYRETTAMTVADYLAFRL